MPNQNDAYKLSSTVKRTGVDLDYYSVTKTDTTTTYPSGTVTSSSASIIQKQNPYEVTYGSRIENYYKLRNSGKLIPHTPFKQYSVLAQWDEGRYDLNTYVSGVKVSNRKITNWFQNTFTKLTMTEQEMHDERTENWPHIYEVQKAAARIATSGHDTLTFLAELTKTRQMFTNLIKKIIKRQYPKNLKDFFNHWLEGRYGWRTLVFDLEDLNEAIQRLGEEQRTRYTERAGFSTSHINETHDLYSNSAYQTDRLTTDSWQIGVRGSVAADIEIENFQFNLLHTAWELVPFSFVLDWLVNVGQFLAGITFLVQNSNYVASGGAQLLLLRTYENKLIQFNVNGSTTTDGSLYQKGTGVMMYTERVPEKVPPIPLISLRLDEFKVIDLIALLIQKFK